MIHPQIDSALASAGTDGPNNSFHFLERSLTAVVTLPFHSGFEATPGLSYLRALGSVKTPIGETGSPGRSNEQKQQSDMNPARHQRTQSSSEAFSVAVDTR